MLHILPEEIIFTGSASESNTLAVVGYALANQHRGRHIITSNVEHSSTAHAAEFLKTLGFEVTVLPVNEQGIVTPQAVKEAMRKDTILVSLMHVNNEMGAVNPISDLADIVHTHPVCVFHTDCTQSFGKLDLPMDKLDMMTMSAHKIHGLKGSAMLIKKKKLQLVPIIQGGQQEQGLRGGTENAPANIALAKTIRLALEEQKDAGKRVQEIRDYLAEEILKIPGAHILSPATSAPYILNISFDAMTSEVLCNALSERDICVSAKSTCSSHDSGANKTLLAIGKNMKDATHGIRLSFSGQNTMEEARQFVATVKEILETYGLPL